MQSLPRTPQVWSQCDGAAPNAELTAEWIHGQLAHREGLGEGSPRVAEQGVESKNELGDVQGQADEVGETRIHQGGGKV